MFSNDAPLGLRVAKQSDVANNLTGHWENLNWLGGAGIQSSLTTSTLINYILGPLWFSKLYALSAFVILGYATYICGQALKFHPWVCGIMGLASALNGSAFSVACWGLASWTMSRAWIWIGLALLIWSYDDHKTIASVNKRRSR